MTTEFEVLMPLSIVEIREQLHTRKVIDDAPKNWLNSQAKEERGTRIALSHAGFNVDRFGTFRGLKKGESGAAIHLVGVRFKQRQGGVVFLR